MKFAPRLMRRREPFGDPVVEVKSLRADLVSAPGVNEVESIQFHHKGGYVALMEFNWESVDDFIEYLETKGWMNVI